MTSGTDFHMGEATGNMKRHRSWRFVLTLLLVAWVPFGIAELLHKLGGLNYYPGEQVALMFGVWLFIWWPWDKCFLTT